MSVFGTLIPFFIDDVLNAPKMWIGIAFTSYNVCATIGLFATGMISDVLGLRRTVILVCMYNVVLLNLQGWVRSVGTLVIVHALLGFGTPYALGLTWVARLVPGPRLARWMAWAVCAAQAALMTGGFLAGAFQGVDLGLVCAILSAVPAIAGLVLLFARDLPTPNGRAAANGGDPQRSTRAGFFRAIRTRYFLCVSFAPFVQGSYMVRARTAWLNPALRLIATLAQEESARGNLASDTRSSSAPLLWQGGMFGTLAPMVLKNIHGRSESDVGRLFQVGGLGALLAHAFFTPWVSSRPWRHRAVQFLSLLNTAIVLVYGFYGERDAGVALVLPCVAFVSTAVCLGCCNLMVAIFARNTAPEALGALTGLTRCMFSVGTSVLPALVVPLTDAGGLLAPCVLGAVLFGVKAFLLTWCASLPPAHAEPIYEPAAEAASKASEATGACSSSSASATGAAADRELKTSERGQTQTATDEITKADPDVDERA